MANSTPPKSTLFGGVLLIWNIIAKAAPDVKGFTGNRGNIGDIIQIVCNIGIIICQCLLIAGATDPSTKKCRFWWYTSGRSGKFIRNSNSMGLQCVCSQEEFDTGKVIIKNNGVVIKQIH
jgi:hypothetical protein